MHQKQIQMNNRSLLALLALFFALTTKAQLVEKISLPQPQHTNKTSLDDALALRKSVRKFSPNEKLNNQQIANLLWAANGINRADGKRTAPSAMDWREIDIYVVMETGAFLWDPKQNVLTKVAAGDHRLLTGTQAFVKDAPLCLVYVADYSKMKEAKPEEKAVYAAVDCGHISQNVYLHCATDSLATVVRASVDKPTLAAKLQLKSNQNIVFVQSVGREVK